MNSEIVNELKSDKRKKLDKFFGQEIHMTSKWSFRFKNVIDNDTVILLTKNIRKVGNKKVLVTGRHSGIFLKDWQILKIHDHKQGINCYAIKINRKYSKSFNFTNIDFGPVRCEMLNFEDIVKKAKEQEIEKFTFKEGWSDQI